MAISQNHDDYPLHKAVIDDLCKIQQQCIGNY